ncbi:MAG: MerR family transcriptional regulator [Octadecabacter sp.]
MSKSRDAFRTISEVSDVLDTPAHVLRFWESKFSQVKPVKRAGGRRYYRPADLDLLAGIKKLLHDDGMTIKGTQKLLREQGVKHVTALGADIVRSHSEPENFDDKELIDITPTPPAPEPVIEADAAPEGEIEITNVVVLPSAAANATETSNSNGPSLSLNLSQVPKSEEESTDSPLVVSTETQEIENQESADAPALVASIAEDIDNALEPEIEPVQVVDPEPEKIVLKTPNVPADPSDNDSKAPARLFNHINRASHVGLAAQAGRIAPLLDRMQVLRDRINLR